MLSGMLAKWGWHRKYLPHNKINPRLEHAARGSLGPRLRMFHFSP
jgi:hypothetical protein